MIGLSTTFVFAMMIMTIFYALDALYAERKDRSILFWRSIPVTDFETVLSKLLIAILVIPLVAFAMIVVTHLAVLLFSSVWISARGGSAMHLIWGSAPFLDNWTATLIFRAGIAFVGFSFYRLVPAGFSIHEAVTVSCRFSAVRHIATARENAFWQHRLCRSVLRALHQDAAVYRFGDDGASI